MNYLETDETGRFPTLVSNTYSAFDLLGWQQENTDIIGDHSLSVFRDRKTHKVGLISERKILVGPEFQNIWFLRPYGMELRKRKEETYFLYAIEGHLRIVGPYRALRLVQVRPYPQRPAVLLVHDSRNTPVLVRLGSQILERTFWRIHYACCTVASRRLGVFIPVQESVTRRPALFDAEIWDFACPSLPFRDILSIRSVRDLTRDLMDLETKSSRVDRIRGCVIETEKGETLRFDSKSIPNEFAGIEISKEEK